MNGLEKARSLMYRAKELAREPENAKVEHSLAFDASTP